MLGKWSGRNELSILIRSIFIMVIFDTFFLNFNFFHIFRAGEFADLFSYNLMANFFEK